MFWKLFLEKYFFALSINILPCFQVASLLCFHVGGLFMYFSFVLLVVCLERTQISLYEGIWLVLFFYSIVKY